jgi:hypothetical protein
VGFQPALDKDGLPAHPTRNNLGIFLFGSLLTLFYYSGKRKIFE